MTFKNLVSVSHCRTFTAKKLDLLGSELESISKEKFCVIVNGSYARREAHAKSDFDYFVLTKPGSSEHELREINESVADIAKKIVGIPPSRDGAFAQSMNSDKFVGTIGGDDDSNQNITRRILFLTECTPVGELSLYKNVRDGLLERYIKPTITNHQLGMFLLNDIIRYYRTVCVDFEQKTVDLKKPWGIRNIKLIFSRKLLYFAGILVAAEMADKTYKEKVEVAQRLTAMPPLDRINEVCGSCARRAFEAYDTFLEKLQDEEFREHLGEVTDDRDTHSEEFKRLKNSGKKFGDHLITALNLTYPNTHPIHKALLM